MQIQGLGEQGILQMLQRFCPAELVGDDGAVLEAGLVVTTDLLVDGVHFSDRTTPGYSAGWRAAAANLSDLAAMGANPVAITVGLALRGDTPVTWLEELYRGIHDCLQPYGTVIVGGDVCRSPVNTVAITALGKVLPGRVIQRSAAQVGDAIVITGNHGLSRAGLELLLHPEKFPGLNPQQSLIATTAHQQPRPRLDVLPYLHGRVAGMDSSDGLADAVIQICRASGVGAMINHLPIPPVLVEMVGLAGAIDWVLYGGEDFELVLCLPLAPAKALIQKLGNGAAIIGNINSNTGVMLGIDQAPPRQLDLSAGFQHF